MEIDKELIDKLLAGYMGPEDLIGEHGLLRQITKALVERAMNAELCRRPITSHDISHSGRRWAGENDPRNNRALQWHKIKSLKFCRSS